MIEIDSRITWIAAVFVALGAACQGTAPKPGPAPAAEPAQRFIPKYDRWVDIMNDVIDPSFDKVMYRQVQKDPAAIDFTAVADAAELCASYIALGYGIHERKDVAGFAQLARETEGYFLDIAARARQHDAAAVKDLVLEGEARYCDRCHDAAG